MRKLLKWIGWLFSPLSYEEQKADLDRRYNEMIEARRLASYPPMVVKFANEKGIRDDEALALLKTQTNP